MGHRPTLRWPLGPLGLLAGSAWLLLAAWGISPYARYLDHAALFEGGSEGLRLVLVFVGGWALMTCATMLPTAFPLARRFAVLIEAQPHPALLLCLLASGYLSVWLGFGSIALAADALIHGAVARTPWLSTHPWVIAAAILILAGAYQLTPLKDACLRQCRSPLSFLFAHWRGRRPYLQAFRLGLDHGAYCLGCCWALMLLMFAAGLGSLAWMLALAAVMCIEKTAPWGRALVAPLGMGLIAAGCLTAVLGLT